MLIEHGRRIMYQIDMKISENILLKERRKNYLYLKPKQYQRQQPELSDEEARELSQMILKLIKEKNEMR